MKTLSHQEAEKNKEEIIKAIKDGKIFIYPTDTVYGIGCNATSKSAVEKLRKIKGSAQPFSVIAPSKTWITTNCNLPNTTWLERLPGPYTFILSTNKDIVANNVGKENTLGVRIPKHWFTEIIQESGVPFVTTSANPTKERTITGENSIPEELKAVDYFINDGTIKGAPSTLVYLNEEEEKVVSREHKK